MTLETRYYDAIQEIGIVCESITDVPVVHLTTPALKATQLPRLFLFLTVADEKILTQSWLYTALLSSMPGSPKSYQQRKREENLKANKTIRLTSEIIYFPENVMKRIASAISK